MNELEYKFIEKEVGNLISMISHRITGDRGVCSWEDNRQDLWVAAIAAVDGYKRQNNGANGSFEEFKDSKGFKAYLKTVLWNGKNKKGIKATKHKEVFNSSVSIQEHGEILNISKDVDSPEPIESFGDKYFKTLDADEAKALDIIVNNPRMITPSGKVDCAKLSRSMNTYWDKARSIIDSLKGKMDN